MSKVKKFAFVLITLLAVSTMSMVAQDINAFITIWETTETTIRYPGVGTNYTIVVRDMVTGNIEQTITNANSPTHETTFVDINGLKPNTKYSLEVIPGTGSFSGFRAMGNAGRDKLLLKEIKQWGKIKWRADMAYSFRDCSNMDLTATDQPDLSLVTVLAGIFWNCSNLVANSSITNWDTSKVVNMGLLFSGCSSFNHPLNWDVSNVRAMGAMFSGATAFNQNLGKWTLNEAVALSSMLNESGMDCYNYDATLIGWANNPGTPAGRTLGAEDIFYSSPEAVAARKKLIDKSWIISGDIYDETCHIKVPFQVEFSSLGARLNRDVATLKATSKSETELADLKEIGFVVATKTKPTINDTKLLAGNLTFGEMEVIMSDLIDETVYYARAFATNINDKIIYSTAEIIFQFSTAGLAPPGFPPIIKFDSSDLVVQKPIVLELIGDDNKVFENAIWSVDNQVIDNLTWTPSSAGTHIIMVTSQDKKSVIKKRIIIK